METLFHLLSSIHPLSESLQHYLLVNLQSRSLRRREYVLKAGHHCRHLWFIEAGLLRCFYLQGESEVSSWFMKEGDVVTSVESFFTQRESYESIQALEDCEVHSLTHAQLEHAYRAFPEFNYIGRVMLQKYYTMSEQRLYSLRMQRGLERFENLKRDHAELVQRVEQKYLASYLGVTEQYLSMLKSQALSSKKTNRIS